MKYLSRISDSELKKKLESGGALLIRRPKACGKTESIKQFVNSIIELNQDEQVPLLMKSTSFFDVFLVFTLSLFMMGASNDIGLFESSGDVGNCKLEGSAGYNLSTGVYTLTGSGLNMWDKTDEFHLAWKMETSDFPLSAKIAFEGKRVNAHRKMGIIIRESLDANAQYADVAVHGDGLPLCSTAKKQNK
jgi:hypothetical protein